LPGLLQEKEQDFRALLLQADPGPGLAQFSSEDVDPERSKPEALRSHTRWDLSGKHTFYRGELSRRRDGSIT